MHAVIIGYGSQAKAWALNLRDSQKEVHIALRKNSPSSELALKNGFSVLTIGTDSLKEYQNFVMLTPDHVQTSILKDLKTEISDGARIVYAHGFSFTKDKLKDKFPAWSHLLLAPKAIASEVRFQFETGGKLGAIYSLEGSLDNKKDKQFLFELAKAIGITAGPYKATFEEETFADLFSEQSILCSLLPYGALHSFNKLMEKGIPEELAYFECWYEVKLIADTMVKLGPQKFFELISPNALIGGEKARKILFDKEYIKKLDQLAEDIWEKKFFDEGDSIDISNVKQEVIDFWKKEKLTQVHEGLKNQLF